MMRRLYRWLLFCYPADYRATFGAEMADVFGEALDATRKRGVWPSVIFCLRELVGLLWATSCADMRIHSGRVDRAEGFILGRAVAHRLIFVLAAIVAVIEVLKSFLPHRQPSQSRLWNEFLLAILPALAVLFSAAVGWGISFLFGRTGLHRIANLNTKSVRK